MSDHSPFAKTAPTHDAIAELRRDTQKAVEQYGIPWETFLAAGKLNEAGDTEQAIKTDFDRVMYINRVTGQALKMALAKLPPMENVNLGALSPEEKRRRVAGNSSIPTSPDGLRLALFKLSAAEYHAPSGDWNIVRRAAIAKLGETAPMESYRVFFEEYCKDYAERKQQPMTQPNIIATWVNNPDSLAKYTENLNSIALDNDIPSNQIQAFARDTFEGKSGLEYGSAGHGLYTMIDMLKYNGPIYTLKLIAEAERAVANLDPLPLVELNNAETAITAAPAAPPAIPTPEIPQQAPEPPKATVETANVEIVDEPAKTRSQVLDEVAADPKKVLAAVASIADALAPSAKTELTIDEISAYRKEAIKIIKAAYPDMTDNEVGKAHNEATNCEGAKDALETHGREHALELVHAYSVKSIMEETEPPEVSLSIVERPAVLDTEVSTALPSWFHVPSIAEMQFIDMLAANVARSGFYPSANTVEKAKVIIYKGLTLGIEPFSALDGIDAIQNKQGGITMFFKPRLLKALVSRTGKCQRFDPIGDDKQCTVTVQKKGESVKTYTFTIEEARQAGLATKWNWTAYPKRMLMWRAIGMAIDIEFPEVRFVMSANEPDDDLTDAGDLPQAAGF